ncbi:MAG: peptidoglycan editing factor PgeF [Candidatus Firestonebacteria bacterium]
MKKAELWFSGDKKVKAFTTVKPLSYTREKLEKNIKSLLISMKVKPKFTAFATQVHGARVFDVKNVKFKNGREADGLLTSKKNILLLVFTADCLPVFLYDKKFGFIGIAHCGWKSTYKNIIGRAVKTMLKKGAKSKDIQVVLGPRIRECCYEVNPEFALKFKSKYGNVGRHKRGAKLYFSLTEVVKLQLKNMKIPAKNIKDTGLCTCCVKQRFFSYRREGKGTGRMVSGIMLLESQSGI